MTTTTVITAGPEVLPDELLRDTAAKVGVRVRPIIRRVTDTTTGESETAPLQRDDQEVSAIAPSSEGGASDGRPRADITYRGDVRAVDVPHADTPVVRPGAQGRDTGRPKVLRDAATLMGIGVEAVGFGVGDADRPIARSAPRHTAVPAA